MLVKHNCNPKAVSVRLGQASEIITLDVYTEKQAILDEIDAMEKIISRVVPQNVKEECCDVCIDTERYI